MADEHDEPCFLDFALAANDENDTRDDSDNQDHEESSDPVSYNSKKPKWWIRKSGRGTKAQRRAVAAMEDYRLPRIPHDHVLDFKQVFDHREIWLEIGFGQGENLLANAQLHPNVGIVGADIHKPGAGNVLKRMHESIENGNYWTDYDLYSTTKDPFVQESQDTEHDFAGSNSVADDSSCLEPYSNVRIHIGDGVKLLSYLSSGSIAAIFVTFPDPFPSKVNEQYRLIQQGTVCEIHRVLVNNGRLFLATDHDEHNEWCRSVFKQINEKSQVEKGDAMFRYIDPCPDRSTWLPVISKYEQKGWDEGRPTLFQCWEKWCAE